MEQNYTESMYTELIRHDDVLLQQEIGDDHELLALDQMLKHAFSKEDFSKEYE